MARAVRTVEFLAAQETASLEEVAELLGVHKSNALRLLTTLRNLNWVSVDPTRTSYSLGPRLAAVGHEAASRFQLERALELAEGVRDITGETVHVSVPHDNTMLVVGRVTSKQAVKVTAEVGTRDSLHSTAVGKAYLATLTPDRLEETLRAIDLVALTPMTIVDAEKMGEEINLTKQRQYALNVEEDQVGTAAIAAAIRVSATGPVVVLSSTGPIFRFSRDVMEKMAPDILELIAPYQALPARSGS